MPMHIPTLGERVTEADIWTYATRDLTNLEDARAAFIDHVPNIENELGFPSTPKNKTLADDGDLDEEEIVVALPTGATITRASLICILEAIQNSTTAQVIDVVVSIKKGDGAYEAVLTLSPALHLPIYEGTTSEIIMPVDVSDVVDAAATYTAKMAIDQVAASVKYVSAYVIIVGYTMG